MDSWVNHHPRPPPQLRVGGNVHEDGLLESHEGIHDHRAEFEHLVEHVALPAGETWRRWVGGWVGGWVGQ